MNVHHRITYLNHFSIIIIIKMLVTIHNLPLGTQYKDVKELLLAKCGFKNLILDELKNDGVCMKVTVGLAEEVDAAILVRKVNGLYYNGQQLYVQDVRQNKESEQQPYQATSSLARHKSKRNNWSLPKLNKNDKYQATPLKPSITSNSPSVTSPPNPQVPFGTNLPNPNAPLITYQPIQNVQLGIIQPKPNIQYGTYQAYPNISFGNSQPHPDIQYGTNPPNTNIQYGTKPPNTNIQYGTNPANTNIQYGTNPPNTNIQYGTKPPNTNIQYGTKPPNTNIQYGNPANTNIQYGNPANTNIQYGTNPPNTNIQYGTKPPNTNIQYGTKPPNTNIQYGTNQINTNTLYGTNQPNTNIQYGIQPSNANVPVATNSSNPNVTLEAKTPNPYGSFGTNQPNPSALFGTNEINPNVQLASILQANQNGTLEPNFVQAMTTFAMMYVNQTNPNPFMSIGLQNPNQAQLALASGQTAFTPQNNNPATQQNNPSTTHKDIQSTLIPQNSESAGPGTSNYSKNEARNKKSSFSRWDNPSPDFRPQFHGKPFTGTATDKNERISRYVPPSERVKKTDNPFKRKWEDSTQYEQRSKKKFKNITLCPEKEVKVYRKMHYNALYAGVHEIVSIILGTVEKSTGYGSHFVMKKLLRSFLMKRISKLLKAKFLLVDEIMERYRSRFSIEDDLKLYEIIKKKVDSGDCTVDSLPVDEDYEYKPVKVSDQRIATQREKLKADARDLAIKNLFTYRLKDGEIEPEPKLPIKLPSYAENALLDEWGKMKPYPLNAKLMKYLDEEVELLCHMMRKELENPPHDADTKAIYEYVDHDQYLDVCKKLFIQHLSKRLSKEPGAKAIRIIGCPKLPKRHELEEFLMIYDCTSLLQLDVKTYMATFNTYQGADTVVNKGTVDFGAIMEKKRTVEFEHILLGPIHDKTVGQYTRTKQIQNIVKHAEESYINILDKNWPEQKRAMKLKQNKIKDEKILGATDIKNMNDSTRATIEGVEIIKLQEKIKQEPEENMDNMLIQEHHESNCNDKEELPEHDTGISIKRTSDDQKALDRDAISGGNDDDKNDAVKELESRDEKYESQVDKIEKAEEYENKKGEGDEAYEDKKEESYHGEGDENYEGEGDENYEGEGDKNYEVEGDENYEGEIDENYEGEGDKNYEVEGDENYEGEGDEIYEGEGDEIYEGEGDEIHEGGNEIYYGEGDEVHEGEVDEHYEGDEHYEMEGDENVGEEHYEGEDEVLDDDKELNEMDDDKNEVDHDDDDDDDDDEPTDSMQVNVDNINWDDIDEDDLEDY